MRYFEYIYLVAALGLFAFLALSYDEMPTGPRIGLIVGIGICSFMYSFRRKQRITFEQMDREEQENETEAQDEP
jgi:hypothetical protein